MKQQSLDINQLRQITPQILFIGSDVRMIQSIIDFDYLAHKEKPSIQAVVSTNKKTLRCFWGDKEISIPVFSDFENIPKIIKEQVNLFFNTSSGRRTLQSSIQAIKHLPNLIGGVNFAEEVPEQHAIQIIKVYQENKKFILGPASIGLLIPNHLKLGVIGGTQSQQMLDAQLFSTGNIAAFSASGGMTNEIINLLKTLSHNLSFSLAFGGERFPGIDPEQAFIAAEKDAKTKQIVYFGELGGIDEYKIAQLVKDKQITKPIIAFIAGNISEMFDKPPQFGHAKAMAQNQDETALAKREALKNVGINVASSYTEFIDLIKQIPKNKSSMTNKQVLKSTSQILLNKNQLNSHPKQPIKNAQPRDLLLERGGELKSRKHALFSSQISGEKNGEINILNQTLTEFATKNSLPNNILSILLGKRVTSTKLEKLTELIFNLTIDHSPQVSGAVNTIISARAGKDLVSALSSGLLTIGPRFGGAINQAAINWLTCLSNNISPQDFVESHASKRKYIQGIGHRKYNLGNPDPRVSEILKFTQKTQSNIYTTFALQVQKITTSKKTNLILNVDGAIAAVFLDLLSSEENYSTQQLKQLTEIEFFNAFFVLARSIGFTAHFLDQRRRDEGLFRLPSEELALL